MLLIYGRFWVRLRESMRIWPPDSVGGGLNFNFPSNFCLQCSESWTGMLGMRKDQLQPYEMMGTPPYVGSEGMRLAYTARVPSDPTYGGVPIITSGYHWSYIVPNIPVHDLKHRRPKVPIMSLPYLPDLTYQTAKIS